MKILDDYFLLIGVDTEYTRETVLDAVDKDGNPFALKKSPARNAVLCYSYSVMNPRTGRKASGITHIPPRHTSRIALSSLLGRVLSAAEASGLLDTPNGKLPRQTTAGEKIKIALVGHFTRADLPGFRDFPKLKKRFDAARGTFASIERPTVLTVRLPTTRSMQASVTLFDTKLLSPASYGSLAAIGAALNFPKLKLPDVVDETGGTVPGITRMDLVRDRHPAAFEQYAKRDAEVCVEWFVRFAAFSEKCRLKTARPTIGATAVEWLKSLVPPRDLAATLGRVMNGPNKIGLDFNLHAQAIQSVAADAFLGGRNECFSVGLYGPEDTVDRPLTDFDLKGAYTTSAVFFRPIDWENIEIGVKDLDRLAVLDRPTLAVVEFSFPEGTRFPSLSVDAGDYGLVHPLKGVTTATGPALVVARDQGATIKVLHGVVLDWLDPNAPRPFLRLVQGVNTARAAVAKKSPHELLAKEAGNSVYGKTAQGVAAMKTIPVVRRLFSTREGQSKPLEPSGITSPLVAAYISGTCRAVLSEILANLPDHVVVLSATTDGWLSSATEAEARAAASGPVATHFSQLRAMADPNGSPEILEIKHAAERVLSMKTRGSFTVGAPLSIDGKSPGEYIIARAGHRLDRPFDSKADEIAAWLDLHANREFDTTLAGTVFKSLREQWEGNADLIDVLHRARVNFDFDLKRRPVNVRDGADGLIKFETTPWETVDEFVACRRAFDRWREICRAALRAAADWAWFSAWHDAPRRASHARRTPFQQSLMVGMAKGVVLQLQPPGRHRAKVGYSRKEIAELLTAAGVTGTTERVLKHARDREPDPNGTTIAGMSSRDFDTLEALAGVLDYSLIEGNNGVLSAVEILPKGNPGNTEGKTSFEPNGEILAQSKTEFNKPLVLNVKSGQPLCSKTIGSKPIGGERAFGPIVLAREIKPSDDAEGGAPAPAEPIERSQSLGAPAPEPAIATDRPDAVVNDNTPAAPGDLHPANNAGCAPASHDANEGAQPATTHEPTPPRRSEDEIVKAIRDAARARHGISDLQLRRGRAAAAKRHDLPARARELAAIAYAIEKTLKIPTDEATRLVGALAVENRRLAVIPSNANTMPPPPIQPPPHSNL